MKKTIVMLLFATISCGLSQAQTGSNKTPAQLSAEVNLLWPDNTSGIITPFSTRQTLLDIIASTAPNGSPTILYAQNYQGATAGDQIVACFAALGPNAGICDARGLPSGGVIPAITLGVTGAALLGPCGFFTVTGTIQIFNSSGIQGFRWEGCNSGSNLVATSLFWAGNNTDPMIRIRGVRDSEFVDLSLRSTSANPLSTAIRSETVSGALTTANIYRNIHINGTTTTGLTKGMQWCTGADCGGTTGGDANNDVNWIEGVSVQNYSNCAFSLEGTQVKSHNFFNSQYGGGGARGVCTTQASNPARNSGSFQWIGGGGGGATVADFDLGSPNDAILIQSGDFEGSNRLLQTGGPGGSSWPITLINNRWAADFLNADNNVIFYQFQGPLTLIGNIINGPQPGSAPKFSINTNLSSGVLAARGVGIGNSIAWGTAIASSQPFITNNSLWNLTSNLVIDTSTGAVFPVPDAVALGVSCSVGTLNTATAVVVNGIVTHC